MTFQSTLLASVFLASALSLTGCQTNPIQTSEQAKVQTRLSFVDLSKFDTELHAALTQQQGPVTVVFYDPVSPNQLPERLQKWLSNVEQSGGKVDIQAPEGDMTAKNPALLLSLFSGLWNGLKALSQIRDEQVFRAAKDRNATLELERDTHRNMVVKRLVFVPRPTKS